MDFALALARPVLRAVAGLLGLLMASLPVLAAEQLRFGVGLAWAPPFAQYEQGRLSGGILLELLEQIARNADAEAVIVVLPPRRVDAALAQGDIDLQCPLSPAWFPEPPAAARWSVPLLTLDDLLVAAPGQPEAAPDLARAGGLTIGVVGSYSYPPLEEGFRSGRLLREDAPSQQLVLEKLVRGRSGYGVVNSMMLEWFNKTRPPDKRVRRLATLASVQTHCLLSAKPGLAPERIQAAVRQLVDSGQLKAILARYR